MGNQVSSGGQPAQQQAYLDEQGLEITEAPMDNNCVFHCLASLEGHNDHGTVRNDICRFLSDHGNEYFPRGAITDDYVATMSNLGVWGGQIEIQAWCHSWNVNVTIHFRNQTTNTFVQNKNGPKDSGLKSFDLFYTGVSLVLTPLLP